LLPHLDRGDLVIDAGNSYFKDTDLRARHLAAKAVQFLGVGVSGGEEGARHGPSIMPGGPKESYERVRPVFEAAAAKVDGDPCVTWLGPGSAGHFVKMVHNEYQEDLRRVVSLGAEAGLPIPGLMVSLGYLDAYRSAWLPANLVQAQRDFFGAHTYERNDTKGTFHTEWASDQPS
jgi:6-phosphogluconate dehydrogenase